MRQRSRHSFHDPHAVHMPYPKSPPPHDPPPARSKGRGSEPPHPDLGGWAATIAPASPDENRPQSLQSLPSVKFAVGDSKPPVRLPPPHSHTSPTSIRRCAEYPSGPHPSVPPRYNRPPPWADLSDPPDLSSIQPTAWRSEDHPPKADDTPPHRSPFPPAHRYRSPDKAISPPTPTHRRSPSPWPPHPPIPWR